MKYRKKPVVIEAVQWHNGDKHEAVENNPLNNPMTPNDPCIKTLEGYLHVSDGDFIIKGVNGEFYPCKPDIFEKTYEKVED